MEQCRRIALVEIIKTKKRPRMVLKVAHSIQTSPKEQP